MPNYKRVIPRPPTVSIGGVSRMYLNADGDLVVEYESGNIVVIDTNGGGTGGTLILDGEFAADTQVVVYDGGDAGTGGTLDVNSGGSFETL